MQANYVQRVRFQFGKQGPARWIGHLDVARTWERALNRAQIPVAYTQGFNRRPRMQFTPPLPLGYTSASEYVDLWLGRAVEPAAALADLRASMAPGLPLYGATEIDLQQPALPTLTRSADYLVTLKFNPIARVELAQRVAALLAADEVRWEKQGGKRKGKAYDLGGQILALSVGADEAPPTLSVTLVAEERNMGRPDHLLAALDLDPLDAVIHRTALMLAEHAAPA